MLSAEILKSHINGKSHQRTLAKLSMTENPKVPQTIEKHQKLEAVHRAASKDEGKKKGAAFIEKVKALEASLSPEELKARKQRIVEDRKRKRAEDGLIESGVWECQLCKEAFTKV